MSSSVLDVWLSRKWRSGWPDLDEDGSASVAPGFGPGRDTSIKGKRPSQNGIAQLRYVFVFEPFAALPSRLSKLLPGLLKDDHSSTPIDMFLLHQRRTFAGNHMHLTIGCASLLPPQINHNCPNTSSSRPAFSLAIPFSGLCPCSPAPSSAVRGRSGQKASDRISALV